MNPRRVVKVSFILLSLVLSAALAALSQSTDAKTQVKAGVLAAADLQKVMPQSFFYAGQTAPVQSRNSSGAHSAQGKIFLAGLVDSSGYSTGIAEKYQGFLVTDATLKVGDAELKPGAYGFGALPDGKFIITDLGGNTLFTTTFQPDNDLKRPRPLWIAEDGAGFRLYLGKKYVAIQFVITGK